MRSGKPSRREILQMCLATGTLVASPRFAEAMLLDWWEEREAQQRKPTPRNALGPFYKKHAPRVTKLVSPTDPGLPLVVSGKVLNTRGDVLPDARIEVWHADHLGKYDLEGYRCRGELLTKSSGQYRFETVVPGHYPDRVAQHVHYLVSAPGHKSLATQLYFATDPVFEGDPDRNFVKDPLIGSRELVRPVTLTGDPQTLHAAVLFEICLETA